MTAEQRSKGRRSAIQLNIGKIALSLDKLKEGATEEQLCELEIIKKAAITICNQWSGCQKELDDLRKELDKKVN